MEALQLSTLRLCYRTPCLFAFLQHSDQLMNFCLARPRFRRRPSDVIARAHSDAVLECDVDDESSSSAVTIDWLKNGDPLVGSDYFLIDDGGRKLSILGLVPSDAGMYQCTATNDVGMVQTAARLVVVPKGMPHCFILSSVR